MNPARLALYALLPLILLNSALWAWYVGSVAMAALWPLLGAGVAALTNWSEPRAGDEMIYAGELLESVMAEMERGAERYGLPTSTHESYGVLAEEIAELLEAIRDNNLDRVRHEATQVAAVAMRLVEACDNGAFRQRSVK